ncbi:hypothetical protein [Ekhidna sp.]
MKTIKFIVPDSSNTNDELCLGQRVEITRDPYKEPLPVIGILIGLEVKPAKKLYKDDPLYDILVKVRTDDETVRTFHIGDDFIKPLNIY